MPQSNTPIVVVNLWSFVGMWLSSWDPQGNAIKVSLKGSSSSSIGVEAIPRESYCGYSVVMEKVIVVHLKLTIILIKIISSKLWVGCTYRVHS